MLTHQQHRTDGPRGGPITGGQVVPSHWRNTPQGGPMPLAGDTPPTLAIPPPAYLLNLLMSR